ncbi:MAG TPA: hypothetical protein VK497_03615 [Candidatus Saccharimonadales bacterium]|nr:hypothetical protein [Candidatus Saccharimonadales bacterium]
MTKQGVPHVQLQSVRIERKEKPRFKKTFGKAGTRWWAAVTLDLYDLDREMPVAEWFCLIVCSPENIQNPLKKISIDKNITIIQSELDMTQIEQEAKYRFSKVHPKTWDEFYEQMENYFYYES